MAIERHIFDIDVRVFNAMAVDEVEATVEAMKELGIYRLPYDSGEIVLRIRHDPDHQYDQFTEVTGLRDDETFSEHILHCPKGVKFSRYKTWIESHPTRWLEDKTIDLGPKIEGKRIVHRYKVISKCGDDESRSMFRDQLIVLLASKGIEKCTRANKRAKLGIGSVRDGEYVTTIRLSANLGRHESAINGRAVRPHLRRGHIRSQRHGPENTLVKRIWIDPVFVNADADYVLSRKSYRVLQ